MKTLLALSLALVTWTAAAQSTNVNKILAGPFTNAANGHFYYLLKTATWTQSEAWAVSLGGHLATVRNEHENQWLVNTFSTYGGLNRPLFIGLTDNEVEGAFYWTSGEPLTYTKWNTTSGEPNNASGAYEEDYAYIIQPYSGNPTVLASFWNDVPNDGYGVIPRMHGVLETTNFISTLPPRGEPPVAQVRLGCLEICWLSQSNIQYQVQFKPTIFSPLPGTTNNWLNLGPVVLGTGAQMCVTDTPHGSNRLYRVELVQP